MAAVVDRSHYQYFQSVFFVWRFATGGLDDHLQCSFSNLEPDEMLASGFDPAGEAHVWITRKGRQAVERPQKRHQITVRVSGDPLGCRSMDGMKIINFVEVMCTSL